MKKLAADKRVWLIVLAAAVAALMLGYYFGYDHGWENAIKYLTS